MMARAVPLVLSLLLAVSAIRPASAQEGPAPKLQYHAVKQTGWPTALEVPLGFTVEEAAAGLTSPRFMALDADGSLGFGSHTAGQVVRLPDTKRTGLVDLQQKGASNPTYVHRVLYV